MQAKAHDRAAVVAARDTLLEARQQRIAALQLELAKAQAENAAAESLCAQLRDSLAAATAAAARAAQQQAAVGELQLALQVAMRGKMALMAQLSEMHHVAEAARMF